MTVDNTKLWTAGGFRDDDWQRGTAEDVLASNASLILSLSDFLSLPDDVRESSLERLAVEILPGESVDQILPFLDRLSLIALAFPAYNDGRSYSKAALLRTRYGYKGSLRATGDVLFDQVSHMLRCGFSQLEVRHGATVARLEAGNTGGIPYHYQPAASAAGPERYAWRRIAL